MKTNFAIPMDHSMQPVASQELSEARAYLEEGQFEEALELLGQIFEQGTGEPIVLRSLIEAYKGLQDWEGLDEICELWQERWDPTADLFLAQAEARMKMNNYEQALQSLESARTLPRLERSAQFELYRLLAEYWVTTGNYQDATSHYHQAMALAPNNPCPHIGLGVISLQQEKFYEACSHFNRALSLSPKHDRAQCGLAMALWHLGEKDQAYDHYREVISRDISNTTALFGLITAAYDRGDLSTVEHYLYEYLRTDPENKHFRFSLAGCLFAEEKYPEARDEIELVLLQDASYEGAKELKESIEECIVAEDQAAFPAEELKN